MAEIVPNFVSKRGRPETLPWEIWMDGKARELYRGTDFPASLISMRTMIHRKARNVGLRAYTHIDNDKDMIKVIFYE